MVEDSKSRELLEAVQFGEIEEVRALLERGGDPNYSDDEGYSLLHWATQEDHADIVRLLVKHGARIDVSSDGIMPLANTAGAGNTTMVQLLLALGADPNYNSGSGTALHYAVAYKYKDIIELLLAHGADVNARDEDGRTAIFRLAEDGCGDLIQLLLSHGAKKEVRDKDGMAPWDVARVNGREDVIPLLLIDTEDSPSSLVI